MLISDRCHFSDIRISQGSVVTCFRRGEIFKHLCVVNLLPILSMKKVWKSVNIWSSYGQEFGVLFFLTHSVYARICIYRVARKNVPKFRMALCNRLSEMNQQKSMWVLNMSMNVNLKRFHISRVTYEIVLHVMKQCLQAVRHLRCWLYAGYTRTSQ